MGNTAKKIFGTRVEQASGTIYEKILVAFCSSIKQLTSSMPAVAVSSSSDGYKKFSNSLSFHLNTSSGDVAVYFDHLFAYAMVEYLAGGAQSHSTNIINKPFSALEIQMCRHIAELNVRALSGEGYPFQLSWIGTRRSMPGISNESLRTYQITIGRNCGYIGLDPNCDIPPLPQSNSEFVEFSELPESLHHPIRLSDSDLAAWLHEELPQVGAVILSSIGKEQAARVLGLINESLAVDISRRLLVLGVPHREFIAVLRAEAFERTTASRKN